MYKKIILLVLLTGILLLLSACTSVEVGNKLNQQKITIGEETPIAHIYANCFGYYLFNCIPLVTGDTEDPNSFCMFEHTVKAENVVELLTKEAKKRGATRVIDITSQEEQTGWFSMWISWYRNVQVSGNAVKDNITE